MASSFPAEVVQRIKECTTVYEYTPSQVAGETGIPGDFVEWDDSNNWMQRCGADPTAIAGIVEVDTEKARLITPNGKVPVRLIQAGAVFRLASTTTPVEATHVGQSYGIARDANGHWLLDISDTTNTIFTVIGIDIPSGSFFCIPIAGKLAYDGIVA